MKRIIEYQCEICYQRYDSSRDAIKCEDRGPGREFPIGCIYGNHDDTSMYEQITFAVAQNRIEKHANYGSSWACRDTGAGDSLGKDQCAGNSLYLNKHYAKVNPKTEHFKRMVKYLMSQQIDITVWAPDGAGYDAVSYATFMKRWREAGMPRNLVSGGVRI